MERNLGSPLISPKRTGCRSLHVEIVAAAVFVVDQDEDNEGMVLLHTTFVRLV